jgi:hypothetical protein
MPFLFWLPFIVMSGMCSIARADAQALSSDAE